MEVVPALTRTTSPPVTGSAGNASLGTYDTVGLHSEAGGGRKGWAGFIIITPLNNKAMNDSCLNATCRSRHRMDSMGGLHGQRDLGANSISSIFFFFLRQIL